MKQSPNLVPVTQSSEKRRDSLRDGTKYERSSVIPRLWAYRIRDVGSECLIIGKM